jgi:beta-phosphoglucomutase-like phosphatase (HAD superfamily)
LIKNPRVRAVLFDWDGTLADTAEPVAYADD